ncbi:hypothetical protein [Mucilaginibacter pocheonensis]|uniref:Lamin Tail Domain n=1 Tax=Mucilaginibacter pocheonensis TaxID=398050 RepID=A0ABU1T7H3_9SPHI|nr:hypothetical protein [Mucilaginibacter pocheonensis]MDR6941343.1 hypothetical protein [Mucilaginibacter pocheonensis]
MSLKIINVVNANKPEGEYVVLKTEEDLNTAGYAVVDRTFDMNGKVSNEFRHIFVFPNLKIKNGDYIFLHTAKGTYSSNSNRAGTTTHHLYWGSGDCVWNDNGGDVASLISYKLVNSVKVPPVA